MTTVQAMLIAVLQGATELFPVSSLGHAVVLPALLGWHIDQKGLAFLPFLVMLHLGTAVALLLYFRRDWIALATGCVGLSGPAVAVQARRVLALIVVATIPAVVIGFVLEKPLRNLFGSPLIAACFLALNGLLLLLGERLRGAARTAPADGAGEGAGGGSIADLTMGDALNIGFWQCLAFLPGLSRSGATIAGGLVRGLGHARSAHFSFLIALPIILGATVREVPHLLHASVPAGTLQLSILAAIVSGVVAYASTWFLMRYFRDHEHWALDPFAYYCLVVGAGAFAILRWM